MSKLILFLSWLITFSSYSQNLWEPTWGPNFNTIYYIHKAGSYFFISAEAGCYRSPDGINWEKLSVPVTPYFYNPTLLHFNSCGDRVFGMNYNKLYYSDDQGSNWNEDSLEGVLISYVTNKTIYLASYKKLYFSSDSGRAWKDITGNLPLSNGNICGISTFKNKLYASLTSGNIYNSADSGATWQALPNLPILAGPGYAYEDNNLVNDNDSYLYISNGAGLFRTADEDSLWQDITPSFTSADVIMNFRICGQNIYIGGTWRSFTCDKTNLLWNTIAPYGYVSDIWSDTNYLFAATADGLYRSPDLGQSWNKMYKGIYASNSGETGIFTDGHDLWSTNYLTRDNGDNWLIPFNDTATVIAVKKNIFIITPHSSASPYYGPSLPCYISSDSGMSWKQLNIYPPQNMSINRNYLYMNKNDTMYRSSDFGDNWTQLNTIGYNFFLGLDSIIFISGANGVYKSYDDGTNWISCNNGLPPPAPGWLVWNGSDLVLLNIVDHIYRSTDKGNTWTQLPEDGLDIFLRTAIAASAEKIYITGYSYGPYGSEIRKGIFEMTPGDTAWQVMNNDPSINPSWLLVKDNYLFGTFGTEGIKRYKLYDEISSSGELKNIAPGLVIYPNPADNSFSLKLNTSEPLIVKIYSLSGKEVFNRSYYDHQSLYERISIPGLAEGMYIVQAISNNTIKAGKLIISK